MLDGGREALMMAQALPTYFEWHHSRSARVYHDRLVDGRALRTVELGGNRRPSIDPQLMLLQSRALQSCGTEIRT